MECSQKSCTSARAICIDKTVLTKYSENQNNKRKSGISTSSFLGTKELDCFMVHTYRESVAFVPYVSMSCVPPCTSPAANTVKLLLLLLPVAEPRPDPGMYFQPTLGWTWWLKASSNGTMALLNACRKDSVCESSTPLVVVRWGLYKRSSSSEESCFVSGPAEKLPVRTCSLSATKTSHAIACTKSWWI